MEKRMKEKTQTIKHFIKKHKIALAVFFVLFIIGGIAIYSSYAYFTDSANSNLYVGTAIVDSVLNDSNIEYRFYVEEDSSTYVLRDVPPSSSAYTFMDQLSSCQTVTDNQWKYYFSSVFANGQMAYFPNLKQYASNCNLYFSLNEEDEASDVKVIVKKEASHEGCGSSCEDYTNTTASPSLLIKSGYLYSSALSSCTNGATISFNYATNEFEVASNRQTECTAYFVSGENFSRRIKRLYPPSSTGYTSNTQAYDGADFITVPDNYGDSYIFIGAVNYNWVRFANKYWRILRINGDDSVRLVYAGTAAPTSSDANWFSTTSLVSSKYNSVTNTQLAARYFYNGNNSTISLAASTLNTWYTQNLNSYSAYIADSYFCNNTRVYTTYNKTNYLGHTVPSISGTIYMGDWNSNNPVRTTSLKCPDLEDTYSVTPSKGNGFLTYPIGTLSFDEMVMAIGYGQSSTDTYLYSNANYFSMSPYDYDLSSNLLRMFIWSSGTNKIITSGKSTSTYNVRPVISLASGITATGSGTYADPFVIVTPS